MKQEGRINRFFIPDLAAEQRFERTLDNGESHHALHVLRLKAGAEVELFDGHGCVADGVISGTGRGSVTVTIRNRRQFDAPAGVSVKLAFAEPKGKRLDWLLEKATELAAAAIQPVIFERSVAGGESEKMSPSKRRRWLKHCIAAAKQSGLNFLPELCEPVPLASLLASVGQAVGIVGVCEDSGLSPAEAMKQHSAGQPVTILVGPEGGMTDAELAAAVGAGFKPVRLGTTVLRIETAAIAMLAAIRAVCE